MTVNKKLAPRALPHILLLDGFVQYFDVVAGVYEGNTPYTCTNDNGRQDAACEAQGNVVSSKGGLNQ
jgi:hypothetical protein